MKNKSIHFLSSIPGILFFTFLLTLTSCAHLTHYSAAQDAFNKAANMENASKLGQVPGPSSPDSYYALAYAKIQKALKNSGKLDNDGVIGNAYALQALCEWKLNEYDNARNTALTAISYLQDENPLAPYITRDLAVMKALDALMTIDQSNNALLHFAQSDHMDTIRHRFSLIYADTSTLVNGKIETALNDLQKIGEEVNPNNDVRIYFSLSTMTGLKVWSDALDALKQTLDTNTSWTMDEKRQFLRWYKGNNEMFNQQKNTSFGTLKEVLPGGEENQLYEYWALLLGGEE